MTCGGIHVSVPLRLMLFAMALTTPLRAIAADDVATASTSVQGEAASSVEPDTLQQRLTEREDRRRPLTPWTIQFAGRPLTLGGEYDLQWDRLRDRVFGTARRDPHRAGLDQELELEAFYSLGPKLSLFAQGRVEQQRGLLSRDSDVLPGRFAERGEMWLNSQDVGGSGLDLDVGRLNFEDDRRWWWDDELDAIRLTGAGKNFEIAVALARELAPRRSGAGGIDPEQVGVRRLIAEASWDWRPDQTLQGLVLHQDDRSATESVGQIVATQREDSSDARLTWVGARATGGFTLRRGGVLGYWFDWGLVRGRERLVEYGAVDTVPGEPTRRLAVREAGSIAPGLRSPQLSAVEGVRDLIVSGWGVDAGVNWLLPLSGEPRLYAGIASGSGDNAPDDRIDHAFRQTGLQANESGFGGVQRFPSYGVLLDPELSNLRIATLGGGMSLLHSSSLDLVFHRYRLAQPASSLRNARFDVTLDGRHRDLGSAVDLVLALEEWERLEFECTLAAFHAGHAFGLGQGAWSTGAVLTMRVAF